MILPLDDTAPLKFNVEMKVHYTSTQNSGVAKDYDFKQELELAKALFAGKSYKFIFTLTFYGDYLPSDLALNIQEYTPVALKPGDVGGD
ncbi:MAG: hypothetical protein LUE99_14450 [Bacteroides sp.]|nr:hypothetical protein [Bacteroides sp.]